MPPRLSRALLSARRRASPGKARARLPSWFCHPPCAWLRCPVLSWAPGQRSRHSPPACREAWSVRDGWRMARAGAYAPALRLRVLPPRRRLPPSASCLCFALSPPVPLPLRHGALRRKPAQGLAARRQLRPTGLSRPLLPPRLTIMLTPYAFIPSAPAVAPVLNAQAALWLAPFG